MKRDFMRVDGQLRELALGSVPEFNSSERCKYPSNDGPPYWGQAASETGEPGYEAVGYTGRITASQQDATASVMFKGDSGG
ncbi:hypothetical protein QEZ52_16685 [Aliisedimentitalea scapharcae]|uniref:Uncharacterized protein n=1 Tax=Aliisedimentitalea scapharcae TaxID=1524259 RepID=A0ABZ2XSA7_9RHOB